MLTSRPIHFYSTYSTLLHKAFLCIYTRLCIGCISEFPEEPRELYSTQCISNGNVPKITPAVKFGEITMKFYFSEKNKISWQFPQISLLA